MVLGLVISIIVIIVIIAFIFWLVKALIKAIMIAISIIVIALIIIGVFVGIDAVKFQNGLANSNNLFILQDEGFLAGFTLSNGTAAVNTISELKGLEKSYNEGNYKGLLSENYKVFIFKIEAFEINNMTIGGFKLDKESVIPFLKSNDSIEFLASKYKKEQGMNKEITKAAISGYDQAQLKGIIFSQIFYDNFKQRDALLIVKEYKKKNLFVYPETTMFKFIKFVPTSLIKRFMDMAKEKANQSLETAKEQGKEITGNIIRNIEKKAKESLD